MTNDDNTNPSTPSKPPQNATTRQPTRSHNADVTGAKRNIIPRPIETTQPKIKDKWKQQNVILTWTVKSVKITNQTSYRTSSYVTVMFYQCIFLNYWYLQFGCHLPASKLSPSSIDHNPESWSIKLTDCLTARFYVPITNGEHFEAEKLLT